MGAAPRGQGLPRVALEEDGGGAGAAEAGGGGGAAGVALQRHGCSGAAAMLMVVAQAPCFRCAGPALEGSGGRGRGV